MIVPGGAYQAEVENNLSACICVGVEFFAHRRARLTWLANERKEPARQKLLSEAVSVGMSVSCQERTFPLIAFPTLWIVQGDLVVYVLIGSQMVTPPLPVRGSNVLLCLSNPGASAGVLLLFGNQSFQMTT